jgi:hypothetical protein
MKWSTIKTVALVAIAAIVLWKLGSLELLAGLGLGSLFERERNRQRPGKGANGGGLPDRAPAEEASTSSVVDEAAQQHADRVETPPPEADSPSRLFEQQADEL